MSGAALLTCIEDIGPLWLLLRLNIAARLSDITARNEVGRASIHPAAVNAEAICSREPMKRRFTRSAGLPSDFLVGGVNARLGRSDMTGARLSRSSCVSVRASSSEL